MMILLDCGRLRLLTRLRVTFSVPKVEEIRAALGKKSGIRKKKREEKEASKEV